MTRVELGEMLDRLTTLAMEKELESEKAVQAELTRYSKERDSFVSRALAG